MPIRLTLILFLSSAAMVSAQGWTATGSNGGSGSGGVSCSQGDGSRTCIRTGSWTTGKGYTASREKTRTRTADNVTVTRNATNFAGRTFSSTHNRSR